MEATNPLRQLPSEGRTLHRQDDGLFTQPSPKSYGSVNISHDASAHLGDYHQYGDIYHIEEAATSKQNSTTDQIVADWLGPSTYIDDQNDAFALVQPGTGQWFLNGTDYANYLHSVCHNVMLSGIPGSGKTLMTSIIINDLRERFWNDSRTMVLFLYNSYKRQHEQTAPLMFASLLRQAFLHNPDKAKSVVERFKYHRKETRMSRPNLSELVNCLHEVLEFYSQTFLVIDALDECVMSGNDPLSHRHLFLTQLETLQKTKTTKINILITTRPTHENLPLKVETVEFRAAMHDVASYVSHRLQLSNKQMFRRHDIHEKVQNAIMSSSNGMFLLAKLQLDILAVQSKPSAVLKMIENALSTATTLETAYQETLSRIKTDSYSELAGRTLGCLVFSKEPLTVLTLRHAVAIEEDMEKVTDDDLDEVQDILNACAGVVTVDNDSSIIRLVHHTTQEFFETLDDVWFDQYRSYLTKVCALSLSKMKLKPVVSSLREKFPNLFASRSTHMVPTLSVVKCVNPSNPLHHYTRKFWREHLFTSGNIEYDLLALKSLHNGFVTGLLFNEINMNLSLKPTFDLQPFKLGFGVKWMHLLAFLNLQDLFELSVQHAVEENDANGVHHSQDNALSSKRQHIAQCQDRDGNKSLVYAAAGGHLELLRKLVSWSNTSIDKWDRVLQSALFHALRLEKEEVSTWLVSNVGNRSGLDIDTYGILLKSAMTSKLPSASNQLVKLRSENQVLGRDSFLSAPVLCEPGIFDILLDGLSTESQVTVFNYQNIRFLTWDFWPDSFGRHFGTNLPKLLGLVMKARPEKAHEFLLHTFSGINQRVLLCPIQFAALNSNITDISSYTPFTQLLIALLHHQPRWMLKWEFSVLTNTYQCSDFTSQSLNTGTTDLRLLAVWKRKELLQAA